LGLLEIGQYIGIVAASEATTGDTDRSTEMISREDLPDDAAAWTGVAVTFERLSNDSAESCPRSEDDVFEYVRMESADTDAAERTRLRFVRTARVADAQYWMWEYSEADGDVCYVIFRRNPDGSTYLGLTEPNGLSHEQYLLADYYDEIYWS
jgi:hypothetical protein